jgi:gamma-glutamyltranspeptidase/glutathione hydrolase
LVGLVEPLSSGVGGGGFMLYYEAKAHGVTALVGR